MLITRLLTTPIVFALMLGGVFPPPVSAQQDPDLPPPPGQLIGTAEDEAFSPVEELTVRARSVDTGVIAVSSPLDAEAAFTLAGLPPGNYVVELLDPDSEIVCTDGPFQLTAADPLDQRAVPRRESRDGATLIVFGEDEDPLVADASWIDINIECGSFPAAWWLLAAGAAAGLTTGVAVGPAASPSQ